jgi:hypothetical protein
MATATPDEIKAALSGFPRVLNWGDFRQVKTAPDPSAAALTASGYQLAAGWKARLKDGEYRVHNLRVSVSLSHTSWAIPSARSNSTLLLHEQGHYDITGLIARDLVRGVLNLSFQEEVVAVLKDSGDSPAQHLNYVQKLFNDSVKDLDSRATTLMDKLQTDPATGMDGIYDTDTAHSANTANQAKWNSWFSRLKGNDDDFGLWLAIQGVI